MVFAAEASFAAEDQAGRSENIVGHQAVDPVSGETFIPRTPSAPGEAAVPFTQESAVRGIQYPIGSVSPFGYGAAFADLDGDGDADFIAIGRADGVVGIYENDGTGHFLDRSLGSGIPLILNASGVTSADYDGDGDLDLFFSNWLATDNLARNEGGFQFSDQSEATGLAGSPDAAGTGSAWGDFDLDGHLDLYIANRFLTGLPGGGSSTVDNRLVRNRGDGAFEDVAAALGVEDAGSPTFQALFFDFDRDGDDDLYLSTDKGPGCAPFRNHLYENLGGRFVEITDDSGTQACADSMGVMAGDFDRNGLPDIYIANSTSGNLLLLNQGNGTFIESAQAAGVQNFWNSWGVLFFDFDNDGHLDLYVCNEGTGNRLYDNNGAAQWPVSNVASMLGVDAPDLSYGVASADIDGDGDLDFVVTNNMEPVRLYINHEGERRQWAKFRVVGHGANHFGVGATVLVQTGPIKQIRQVAAGSNYKSQNDMTLHFGLDEAMVMDAVTVLWPGGATRTLTGLLSRETWQLFPSERLGDGDGDGAVLLNDFTIFASCFNQPFAPGCEVMDFDGDADVDEEDFTSFLDRFAGPLADCDENGTLDLEDILADPSLDADLDGVIDSCAAAVAADLNGDGVVNGADLAALLASWGPSQSPADLDGNGIVNGADLAALLASWTG